LWVCRRPKPRPTYEEVCGEKTGHAEVIKIDFDPRQISLAAIIDYFWKVHNPTQVGGQGATAAPSTGP